MIRPLRLRPIAWAVISMLMMLYSESRAFGQTPGIPGEADEDAPSEIEFNSEFLAKTAEGESIDVSQFSKGNPVYPGKYGLRLWVNEGLIGRAEVVFIATNDPLHARPCFDRGLLQQMGVDFSKLTPGQIADVDSSACQSLADLIPGAWIGFDPAEQRMDVTLPQASMRNVARGYVDPSLWDRGMTAGLLNYNFNAYHSNSDGRASTDLYLGLNTGLNVGLWRFRHDGSYSSNVGRQARYQPVSTYAQYAIVPWKSEITIGDGYTDGTVFDSFGFRGVNLASDDRMLPDTQRGFAPVVRGIAMSNAKVTINQNGNLLYETTVPPGPFEINDLYATGYGGDLEVVVTEADGARRSFTVPYSSVPQALRPGVYRYSVTAGQYRGAALHFKSNVVSASYQRGLTNIVTLYGGTQFAEGYGSAALGAAFNTGFGAFSGDVTVASTELPGLPRQTGQSYQIRFAKVIPATDTNVTVAAYRYSTRGYLSLADAMMARDSRLSGQAYSGVDREKARFQLSISQDMGGKWGSLYLTGQSQNYWNRRDTDASFQFGYTNHIGRVFYNASIARTRILSTGKWENRFFVGFTIPLGGSTSRSASVTTNVSHSDTDHATRMQMSLAGTAGEHNEFSYNVSDNYGHSTRDSSIGGNASGSYMSSVGTLGASVGADSRTRQYSLSASGGAILHADGLTFGPPLGGANALVEAKGAAGAYINGLSSTRVNRFGYAIVPSLMPYSLNRIDIDPKGLSFDVELKTTGQDIAPFAGAVVKATFETDNRRSVVLSVRRQDGAAVPFGSEVINRAGVSVGQVSQGGRILARGVAETDELLVKWGEGREENCKIEIHAGPQEPAVCR